MPIESVRNVSVEDDWEPSIEQSELLEIEFEYRNTEDDGKDYTFPIRPLYDDYTFSNAVKYKGNYIYKSSPSFGSSSTSEGEFEIRPNSGLIILETSGDRPNVSQIIDSLSDTINQDLKIEQEFVPGREQVWGFLSRINELGELGEIKVIPPFGGADRINFHNGEPDDTGGIQLEDAIGEYPVQSAKFKIEYSGNDSIVEYTDGQLIIESSNPELKEFVYQIFETAMTDG